MNKAGFTLIELLTVIAILSIIMSIAIPRTSGYIERGSLTVDLSNAKIVSNHMIIFHQVRGRWPNSEKELFGHGGLAVEKPKAQSSSSRFIFGIEGIVQLIYKDEVHWCSKGTTTIINPGSELPK